MNCPCIVRVGCKAKKLYIISYVMRHNHPVTAELAEKYPENRRLTENEKREINDLLLSAADNLTVKRHIESRFGKSFTLNDVRQLKYRMRRKNMDKVHPSEQLNSDGDFELDPAPSLKWEDHRKEEYRLAQLEALANELTALVYSADQDTYCERFEFLKELADAWRSGKQPMLGYSDSELTRDSLESQINTEVITTESSFPYSNPSRTYLNSNF